MEPITHITGLFSLSLRDGIIVPHLNDDAIAQLDAYQHVTLIGMLEAAKMKVHDIPYIDED
jgi:hypothetical protein